MKTKDDAGAVAEFHPAMVDGDLTMVILGLPFKIYDWRTSKWFCTQRAQARIAQAGPDACASGLGWLFVV